jgi:hypothetical protein
MREAKARIALDQAIEPINREIEPALGDRIHHPRQLRLRESHLTVILAIMPASMWPGIRHA